MAGTFQSLDKTLDLTGVLGAQWKLSGTSAGQREEFFVSYNKLRGRRFEVTGDGGPKRALAIIRNGIKAFDKKKS